MKEQVKRKYVYKTLAGKIISISPSRTTVSGKYLLVARLEDRERNVWVCNFWDEIGNDFQNKGIKEQSEVYIEGTQGEGNHISVKFFNSKGEPSVERKTRFTKEQIRDYIRYLDTRDMVIVKREDGVRIKRHKSRCLLVNGRWMEKMDYCCRTLGAKEVLAWLGDYNGEIGDLLRNFNATEYKIKMRELIEVCKEIAGDDIQYFSEEIKSDGGDRQNKERGEQAN